MNIVAKGSDRSVRVRFPKALLIKLDEAATEGGRSRNTEIVKRLAESLGVLRTKKPSDQRSQS